MSAAVRAGTSVADRHPASAPASLAAQAPKELLVSYTAEAVAAMAHRTRAKRFKRLRS